MLRTAALLGVLFVTALPVYGQLTFSAQDYAGQFFGQTITEQSFFSYTPNPTDLQALINKSGANQTWDFTVFTYEAQEPGATSFVSPPTGVPGANEAAFAAANYATLSEFSDSTAVSFFLLEDDAHYNLGIYSPTTQGPYIQSYNAPFKSLEFPLTMGTSWTASGTLVSQNPILGVTMADVTQSGTVDGYGTLITPAGTAECLRLVFELQTSSQGFTITNMIYTWVTREGITAGATSTSIFGQTILTASYIVDDYYGGGGNNPPATAPQGLTPPDGATDQPTTVSLEWNDVDEATGYDLQVADNAGFTKTLTLVVDEEDLDGTSYQVTGLSEGATYFWRVRARNDAGAGPWSGTPSFTTETSTGGEVPDQVVLDTPASGADDVGTMPTLSWQAATGAESYELQIAVNPRFTSLVFQETGLTGTSREVGPLENGTTYYWRVRATNGVGDGPWSEIQDFATVTDLPIERVGDGIPESVALYANYPNPFNPSTEILFDLPATSEVRLTIYDLAGREVVRLVDQVLPAGTHRATFDAAGLPSGTYLYRLVTPHGEHTRPMALIR